MALRFGDLYEEMLTLEEAIERMRIDIDNADCDSDTKCILQNELEMLEQKYYDLTKTDFEFANLNFVTIVESIERCLHCVEFAGDFSDLAPAPYAVANTCGSRKIQLSLDDIETITVYEVSKKSTPDEYTFVKSAMPYRKITSTNEPMLITWDSYRKGISIKGFPAADGSGYYEVAGVEVTLNEPAKNRYKKDKVMACKVLLTTPTPATKTHPLTHAVDGSKTTYSALSVTKNEAEQIFQFFV